jgi:hypothetical protein
MRPWLTQERGPYPPKETIVSTSEMLGGIKELKLTCLIDACGFDDFERCVVHSNLPRKSMAQFSYQDRHEYRYC